MSREFISDELRKQVFERDHYTCRYCGRKKDLQVDHVYPVSKGGITAIENLVTACQHCNVKKNNRLGIWPNPLRVVDRIPDLSVGLVMIAIGVQIIPLFFVDFNFGIRPENFIFAGISFILFGAWLQSKNI